MSRCRTTHSSPNCFRTCCATPGTTSPTTASGTADGRCGGPPAPSSSSGATLPCTAAPTAPAGTTLTRLGAPNLLLASAALTVFGVIGYAGVAAGLRVFVAGIGTGVAGLLGAVLCFAGMAPTGAAAVTLTVAIGMLPGYP